MHTFLWNSPSFFEGSRSFKANIRANPCNVECLKCPCTSILCPKLLWPLPINIHKREYGLYSQKRYHLYCITSNQIDNGFIRRTCHQILYGDTAVQLIVFIKIAFYLHVFCSYCTKTFSGPILEISCNLPFVICVLVWIWRSAIFFWFNRCSCPIACKSSL